MVTTSSISSLPDIESFTSLGTLERDFQPPNHQLEGSTAYLLITTSHTNYNTLTPALIARFQGFSHGVDVADTLKSVVKVPVSQTNQMLHDRFVHTRQTLIFLEVSNFSSLMSMPTILPVPGALNPTARVQARSTQRPDGAG